MAKIAYRDALNQAMEEELKRDDRVFVIGEEVAEYNGAYKVTRGLLDKFDEHRIVDTPITELGFAGLAVGAAMTGTIPIVEFMSWDFALLALDQIINNAAKMYYMSNGMFNVPIVFRGKNGESLAVGSQHCQGLATLFAQFPGIKVIAPTTPYDAKGLLKSAIRDKNPVVVLESEILYGLQGEVPEEEYLIPIGSADVKKQGKDVSLISFGKPVQFCLQVAEKLEKENISVEVVDLRSIKPIDTETIYNSVKKTNRAVVVDESWEVGSIGTYVAHLIARDCFDYLDCQVETVNTLESNIPYNHNLEVQFFPDHKRIIEAVKKVAYK